MVEHRLVFFKDPKANYTDILNGELRSRPHEVLASAFRRDYGAMQEMFFDDPPAPDFDPLLDTLGEIDAMVEEWGPVGCEHGDLIR